MSKTATPPAFRAFLAPKHWPTWLGIGLLCLSAWLPYRARMAIGSGIGLVLHALARERRYITRTNIDLCFPELSEAERRKLVRDTFIANGIGLIETATGWVRPPGFLTDHVDFIGLDVLLNAKAQGRGVLMLGAHYSTLDFGANLLSLTCPFAVTYRPHRNPLFDAFMQRGRQRNCNGVFDRNDLRGALRHLKRGEVLWYAPDQDYGPEHAVYAPFFGRRAATITTPARIAAVNRSPVIFVRHHRREDRFGYELEFTALDGDFPSGDDVRDASLINRHLEAAIRHYPQQYLWMHKRFKTQPGGKPQSPYVGVKTPVRRLSAARYAELTAGARPLDLPGDGAGSVMELPGGLRLRLFPGAPGRLRRRAHAAWRRDAEARQRRLRGEADITVDSLFPVPALGLTAMTYHPPAALPDLRAALPAGDRA